ncbi:hypothetical protein pb186bvf_018132 [Paramecium bursaria]
MDQRSSTQGGGRTAIIPYSEIRRIQLECFGTEDNSKQIQKLELYAKSQDRVKKWPNTINALRKKKDQTRFERFKADEEERRRIEQEEAIYQAQVKKEILERANQQIYENNDRVRAFQGKLLMTDVLQERDAQLEMKEYKRELEKTREQMHHEEILDNVARLEQLEAIKKQELFKKKAETKKIIQEQHEQMINTHIKAIQNEKIEGELIKAKALQLIKDEEDAANARKRKQLENMDEVRRDNENLKEMKRQQLKKEQEEEERIIAYAKKKDQIIEMRKMREELKFKEKLAQRQRLIDAQTANLKSQQENREKLLNKQIKEAEIKAEEVERIKKEKREQLVSRINQSRKVAEEFKQKEVEQKHLSDKEFQQYWIQRNNELKQQELYEINDIKKRNVQLKEFHKRQIDDKYKEREQKIISDIEEQQEIQRNMENQNKTFGSWAERAIKEWSDNGKNVYPLIKELNTFKHN